MKGKLLLTGILTAAVILLPLISLLADRHPAEPADVADPAAGTVGIMIRGERVTLSMKDYIIGAVAAQMPASLPDEALKAQAVLAHTYALRRHQEELSSPTEALGGADIGDDPALYQAYFTNDEIRALYGVDTEAVMKRLEAAASYALTRTLTFEGEPIIAAFHPISSGMTESALDAWGQNIPYLTSVPSESDAEDPACASSLTLSADELYVRLTAAFPDLSISREGLSAEVTQRSKAGSALTVCLCGESFVPGRSFAEAAGLASAHFDIIATAEGFEFKCLGRGHLVGMSQLGAGAMAASGASADEILAHYFPNALLSCTEPAV
ncbi:MAG: SpoIID/LytB domain-containing protein [Ruminococcus sp.]|nr:SpoIID/LytB domain-containing protein [Ruminococcus sp.]